MGGMNTDVFEALANPIRRDLLTLLRQGPQPVKTLAAHFTRGRPTISNHLAVLKSAGLVREVQRGREHHYHLDAEPLRAASAWLAEYERFWASRMDNLENLLQEQAR